MRDWGTFKQPVRFTPEGMILSPSCCATLKFCPRAWAWRYVANLTRAARPQKHQMVMGSIYHAATAAYDLHLDPKAAVEERLKEIRLESDYLVSDSALLDHLRDEYFRQIHQRYLSYLRPEIPAEETMKGFVEARGWTTLAVEESITFPLWEFFVKTIPDKVIEWNGGLWVVERKTTERDDSQWHRKWSLNAQTTIEVIAAENHYQREVEGVIIEQVVITRKRFRLHSGLLPQAINKVSIASPRMVPKSSFVKEECKLYLKGVAAEISWRRRSNRQWEPNYNSCGYCGHNDICLGRVPPEEALVAMRKPRT